MKMFACEAVTINARRAKSRREDARGLSGNFTGADRCPDMPGRCVRRNKLRWQTPRGSAIVAGDLGRRALRGQCAQAIVLRSRSACCRRERDLVDRCSDVCRTCARRHPHRAGCVCEGSAGWCAAATISRLSGEKIAGTGGGSASAAARASAVRSGRIVLSFDTVSNCGRRRKARRTHCAVCRASARAHRRWRVADARDVVSDPRDQLAPATCDGQHLLIVLQGRAFARRRCPQQQPLRRNQRDPISRWRGIR